MLFNSLQFAYFFIVVYGLYRVLPHKWQNYMLLISSYVFYCAWDWRFSFLLVFSTIMDYFCGLAISKSEDARKKKIFLVLSVVGNLTILAFFKYFNFFISNFQVLLEFLHLSVQLQTLNLIMPLGISFYTFQTMSYTIDISRGKMKPTHRFFDFALYVSFFPQLIAGPIERAYRLLPQITSPRKITLNKFYEGCFLIYWGLFTKIFIADNLAKIVDPYFAGHASFNGAELLLASYIFTFQIFCDFAGYSNIARGLGMVMGFDLMVNFKLPFHATNIQDFWNRWHISLSEWIRDYLYMPLFVVLKRRIGGWSVYVTLLITMSLMGLWHGPAWTYTIFGLYHGILLAVYMILRTKFRLNRWYKPKGYLAKKIWFCARIVFMFNLIAIGMMIFRCRSMSQAFEIFGMITSYFFIDSNIMEPLIKFLAIISPLIIVQYGQHKTRDLLFLHKQHWVVNTLACTIMLYLIIGWGVMTQESFVYFMF